MYFLFLRKILSVITSKHFSKIILFLLPLFLGLNLKGQNLAADSTRIAEVGTGIEKVHSAHKATLYSTFLPGLGQAYNKKYWKIPLIYIGFGSIGYFIHWNNNNYQIMKSAYNDLTDDDVATDSYLDLSASSYYDLDDSTDYDNFESALSDSQDYYRRNRDLLIISIVAFYGINIIDASVDAHFFDFDMSEDLSFNWQPTMQLMYQRPVYGVNCSFTF